MTYLRPFIPASKEVIGYGDGLKRKAAEELSRIDLGGMISRGEFKSVSLSDLRKEYGGTAPRRTIKDLPDEFRRAAPHN